MRCQEALYVVHEVFLLLRIQRGQQLGLGGLDAGVHVGEYRLACGGDVGALEPLVRGAWVAFDPGFFFKPLQHAANRHRVVCNCAGKACLVGSGLSLRMGQGGKLNGWQVNVTCMLHEQRHLHLVQLAHQVAGHVGKVNTGFFGGHQGIIGA